MSERLLRGATLGAVTMCITLLLGCAPAVLDPEDALSTGDYPYDESMADAPFRDQVLADGTVTRDEMEQALIKMFQCFRELGIEGEVWYDLDYSNSYGGDLSFVDKSRGGDDPADLMVDLMMECEHRYFEVFMGFEMDRPVTSVVEDGRIAALACIEARVPEMYAKIDPEWDMDTLRTWVYDNHWDFGDAGQLAHDCVNYYGTPFRSLSEF